MTYCAIVAGGVPRATRQSLPSSSIRAQACDRSSRRASGSDDSASQARGMSGARQCVSQRAAACSPAARVQPLARAWVRLMTRRIENKPPRPIPSKAIEVGSGIAEVENP